MGSRKLGELGPEDGSSKTLDVFSNFQVAVYVGASWEEQGM